MRQYSLTSLGKPLEHAGDFELAVDATTERTMFLEHSLNVEMKFEDLLKFKKCKFL